MATRSLAEGRGQEYDRYGNISCVQNGNTSGLCPQWAFGSSTNQLTTSRFTYDAAGDLTTDKGNATTHTYQWDAEGRVSSADSGSTWSFTYPSADGPWGERVQWVSSSGTQEFMYDPAGNWLGIYGVLDILPWGGRPYAWYTGTDTYFNHINNLGSSSMLTNHAGTAVEDMLFYPWGQNTWQSWGSGGYQFAGMPYYDTTTNTNLTMFRLYSPGLGRWHSPDPLGGDITNPQSLNRYAYVLNNPTSMVDPLGLAAGVGGPKYDCGGPDDPGCNGQTGAWGGGGVDCNLHGMDTPCGIVYSAIGAGAAVQCPNNNCEGSNGYGQLVQYWAFAGAAGAVNGYYAIWGVGSLSYSAEQAAISASLWGAWYLEQTGSEPMGDTWCGYGICSTTVLAIGAPGAGGVWGDNSFSDIPDDTDPEGWWRATNGESPPSDLSIVDAWNSQFGTAYPLYTGTTSGPGRVLYYGPGSGGQECVLTGGLWYYGTEGPCP